MGYLDIRPAGDAFEEEADRMADEVVNEEESPAADIIQSRTVSASRDWHQQQISPSGGKPLSEKERSWYGSRFGADFSGVRIHTGPTAEELTQAIHARAFTVGNDIFFGKGEYNPDTKEGKKLPAHELTHTIQQGKMGSGAKGVQRKKGLSDIIFFRSNHQIYQSA